MPKNDLGVQSDPNDGQWHMLTLSTQPFGYAGYRLFLDGKLAGQLDGNSVPVGKEDSKILVRSSWLHPLLAAR